MAEEDHQVVFVLTLGPLFYQPEHQPDKNNDRNRPRKGSPEECRHILCPCEQEAIREHIHIEPPEVGSDHCYFPTVGQGIEDPHQQDKSQQQDNIVPLTPLNPVP